MTVEPNRELLHRLIDGLPAHNVDVARRLLEVLTERADPSDADAAEPWMHEVLASLSPDELAVVNAAPEADAARLIVEHAERLGILIPAEADAPSGLP